MSAAPRVAALVGTALLAAIGACGTAAVPTAPAAPGDGPRVTARARAVAPEPVLPTALPEPPPPPVAPPPPPLAPPAPVIAPVSAAELSASWRPGCPVPPQDLRAVTVTFTDFGGADRQGRLVVRADVAQAVADVFAELHAIRFPIAGVQPVEAFGGSDDASMAANNTSAFNCRAVTGGTGFSEHSYGTAIDLNPVQNPYVRGTTVLPEAGRAHLDRSSAPGRVLAGDAVVRAFAARGFSWGGDWRTLKDYQHFSLSGG
ncbi:M15 family metallopeptidase [Kineococcus gypseus]|uniref:M15 family metallopeptidase n=1 Tax=Kineococcus gypseus TaxID=1637102 RepID=UPI003D7D457F